MINVLCYGDSNTYGQRSEEVSRGRWPADVRWTGQLAGLLGSGYHVIEEGLGGRTTDLDYPESMNRPGRNGRTYLLPALLSHNPLDVVVLMLGTNDLKIQFGRTVPEAAAAIAGLLDEIAAYGRTDAGQPPKVVLVAPPRINVSAPDFADVNGAFYDATSAAKAAQLAEPLAELAAARGTAFVDAGVVAEPGADGTHFSVPSHERFARVLADEVRRVAG
ncbi:GDSL-type esterase/lipase family protein [Amycolatopsis orientalis]|uniref:GDSL-type esterase/lipase family protein n=1 Tax=Amycolatopsis orientalis TaxID=31958 RepID=UPI0003A710FB|nr:GDSL-type esterase/lipase family protein [Amycolatopsis orientalis]